MNETAAEKSFNVFYDPELSAVVMEWQGYFTSDEFKSGTFKMLETLRSFKAEKVLANIREMVLISIEDQRWMQTFFLPEAIAAGFKTCALVQPVHYFNKVAIDSINDKIDKEMLDVQVFDSVEEAGNWLKHK